MSDPALPDGIRAIRSDDGALVFDMPISDERFLRFFFPLFGLPFFAIGLYLLMGKQETMGLLPLGVGLAVEYAAAYFFFARIELRLASDEIQWTRLFLKRWKTYRHARREITKVSTDVSVRTNGKPSSWSVTLMRKPNAEATDPNTHPLKQRFYLMKFTTRLPVSFGEPKVHWLRDLIARWAEAENHTELDRSYQSSD